MRRIEEKAMSSLTGADGGFLVPDETEAEIGRRLAAISPIRSIATVRTVSAAVLKKPFAISGAQTGWVGEADPRPQTTAPQLAELTFPTMELYAMPAATNALLDDAAVDIDRWIGEEVEQAFAAQEGAAFVNGDGIAKPKGFMTYPTVDESAWAWGSVGTVATGAAGGFAAGTAADAVLDLVYALKAGYRQNASFVMNRRTQATVRKLKDADGNYLWQPPTGVGGRATLMGFSSADAGRKSEMRVTVRLQRLRLDRSLKRVIAAALDGRLGLSRMSDFRSLPAMAEILAVREAWPVWRHDNAIGQTARRSTPRPGGRHGPGS